MKPMHRTPIRLMATSLLLVSTLLVGCATMGSRSDVAKRHDGGSPSPRDAESQIDELGLGDAGKILVFNF